MLSVCLSLSIGFLSFVLLIRATFCVSLVCVSVFCLLGVLVKLSVLAR